MSIYIGRVDQSQLQNVAVEKMSIFIIKQGKYSVIPCVMTWDGEGKNIPENV